MARTPCNHKVGRDHRVREAGEVADHPAMWKCSGCGVIGSWQPDWLYHGNVECPRCEEPQINEVFCGKCAAERGLTPGDDQPVEKRARRRGGGAPSETAGGTETRRFRAFARRYAEHFRALADHLETREAGPSLDGYDLVDGLRAAAELLEEKAGPSIHDDSAANARSLAQGARVPLSKLELTRRP